MSEEKRVATAEILNTSVHVSAKLNDRYQGPPGPPGKDGNVRFEDLTEAQIEQLRGPQGLTGKTPQITVQVETGEPGTEASVMQSGTAEAPVIALTIPRGNVGATPQITVQVKTGEPGTAASVKQTGTAEAPVIELTIPRGATGNIGSLTINGKAPDAAGKVTLTAADVGARADDWMPTAADVGALSGTDATLTQAGKAADAQKVGAELNQLKNDIWKTVYPVGAIYISANIQSPAEIFGGTWEQIKDKFLLATGDSYLPGSTGGIAENTIDVNNLPPAIPLQFTREAGEQYGGIHADSVFTNSKVGGYASIGTGQNARPLNNMPPYLSVYVWKRVT